MSSGLDEKLRDWSNEERAEFFESVATEQKVKMDQMKGLILSMFEMNTLKDGVYDHGHYPPYKEAQMRLIEWGLINGKDCCRF